jgi:predicted Ser/Thr protein kinase
MPRQIPAKQSENLRLTRADLAAPDVRVVHCGRGFQSSVFLLERDGRRIAVKDFSATPRAFRTFVAPLLVRREARALRHLEGAPGVPHFYGKIDALAFAMEFIEGTPLDRFSTGELAPEVFPRVQNAIDAIHARGVSHGDLKRRSNLLLTPDGEIYLIDFAAATIGGQTLRPFANWLQKQMAQIDDKSMPRLKKFVAPELLTAEDIARLENPTGLERLARKLLKR